MPAVDGRRARQAGRQTSHSAACQLCRLDRPAISSAETMPLPACPPAGPPVTALPCSKGKVQAFRALQQQVVQQVAQAFPAASADYQQLRQQQQQPQEQQQQAAAPGAS